MVPLSTRPAAAVPRVPPSEEDCERVREYTSPRRAVQGVDIDVAEALRGWDVSCEARVFAREAGLLEHAHSAYEQVRLDDIVRAAEALAHFALTFAPKG